MWTESTWSCKMTCLPTMIPTSIELAEPVVQGELDVVSSWSETEQYATSSASKRKQVNLSVLARGHQARLLTERLRRRRAHGRSHDGSAIAPWAPGVAGE